MGLQVEVLDHQVVVLLLQVEVLLLQVEVLDRQTDNLVHKGCLHNLLDLGSHQVVGYFLQEAYLLPQMVDCSLHLQVEETDLLVRHFVDSLVHKGYLHNLDLE